MPRKRHDARARDIRYRFRTPAFELIFRWVLGLQTSGGSEIGEAFYAASLVTENDSQSWVTAWTRVARQVERRAEHALAAGHAVSAREAYLRAYVYNRAALLCMDPLAASAEPTLHHAVDCFRRSAALMDPVAEPLTVPCDDAKLPGYFVAPADGRAKRRTLIMIGGGDTCVEDLYLMIGPAAVRRGYNLLIVDLPGQGGLPFDGVYMRPDAENQIPAIVNYALRRPEVDAEGLAAYAISDGGYLLCRALSAEPRIRAAAICRILASFHASMTQPPMSERLARNPDSLLAKAIVRVLNLRPSLILMDVYAWRWGARRYADMLDIRHDVTLEPAAITCPLLTIVGEKEYTSGALSGGFSGDAAPSSLSSQSRLVILGASDGGTVHAMATNLSLMAQLVFDWLDEVLPAQPRMRPRVPL